MYSQFDIKNRPLDVGDLWKKQTSKFTMKVMNNPGLKHHLYDSGIGLFKEKKLKTVTEIETCVSHPFFYFTFISFLFSLTNGGDVFIKWVNSAMNGAKCQVILEKTKYTAFGFVP